MNVDESQPFSNDVNDCLNDNGSDITYDSHFQQTNDSRMSDAMYSDHDRTYLDDLDLDDGDPISAPRLRVSSPRATRRAVR